MSNPEIPEGCYCYTHLSTEFDDEHGFIMHIEPCSHYESNLGGDPLYGRCTLMNCEILDQCKECDINWDDDLECGQ